MNKYAIYTDGLTYPVLEKDGQYYIGVPGTGHFSGQWKFLGVRERLKNSRTIIKPEDALKITDWKFKNGSPRYQVVDLDHGSVRTWAGTSADQQLKSFDTISDSGFNIATKTDKDEEITLEESKKYAIYATYGGDGVYNSKLVDTVDSEEQAVDRVAELQATGVGASYEEIETKKEVLNDSKLKKILTDYFKDDYIIEEKDGKIYTYQKGSNRKIFDIYNNWKELLDTTDLDVQNLEEECSQVSGVASGVNGKIDSFPIDPKEMEKQRFKESIDNSLIQKDFERMNKMKDIDSIKDYLYEITMNQNYNEARNTLISYLKQAILDKNENIINATKYIIDTSFGGLQGLEDFFSLTEAKEDKNTILNFINQCINSGKFNKEQINEIKYGFEDGLTLEQLKIYANPKFDNYQMYEIRWGFKDGLTLEQVKTYADSKISDSEMWNIREKLEGNYEEEDDSLFEALKELINYLNKNTKYNWDANEMYDNCAITESETDYIEVFVDIKDGNKIYTVDNYSYNSLEELVKNMPVLFTDEDEDYDYDSNWEDLDESINDKNLDWIYDENEKLYHCEIDNWYFNIYELEDGTYNLIVDYDEEELQDLDDIFDTLEEAKKKAQEIYNKGISEYNGDDFAGFEYETESKDLTKTLHEIALLEDYEEGNISPQKQKFIDYCKDKIEDLGDVEIYDEDYEENIQYHKLMHTEGIREFEDLYIIADFDNYENENLIAINNENKIVINTPMIDCNGYAGTMQFDKIDKKFYDQLMDYWDDLYMDETIEEE